MSDLILGPISHSVMCAPGRGSSEAGSNSTDRSRAPGWTDWGPECRNRAAGRASGCLLPRSYWSWKQSEFTQHENSASCFRSILDLKESCSVHSPFQLQDLTKYKNSSVVPCRASKQTDAVTGSEQDGQRLFRECVCECVYSYQGQWWSILRTQWPQRLQWWDLLGRIRLHLLHSSQCSRSAAGRQRRGVSWAAPQVKREAAWGERTWVWDVGVHRETAGICRGRSEQGRHAERWGYVITCREQGNVSSHGRRLAVAPPLRGAEDTHTRPWPRGCGPPGSEAAEPAEGRGRCCRARRRTPGRRTASPSGPPRSAGEASWLLQNRKRRLVTGPEMALGQVNAPDAHVPPEAVTRLVRLKQESSEAGDLRTAGVWEHTSQAANVSITS